MVQTGCISWEQGDVLHWCCPIALLCEPRSESVKVLVSQSCLTLCHPMDCSLPGSSVHGILQVRMLEWVAISFSRASSWPRDACIAGRLFTIWATREAQTQVVYNFLVAMLKNKKKRELTLIVFKLLYLKCYCFNMGSILKFVNELFYTLFCMLSLNPWCISHSYLCLDQVCFRCSAATGS